jgi:tRNA threonylcarbamoyladenosine biosynthesis protein TsaB
MRLLAIDTCLGACSVAVAVDRVVRACHYEERRTGHAEAIVPMIERVLAEAELAPGALDRIAVTHGPGTFAGIRIGLAAAEGLRLATGAQLVAISSLWAIGQRVLAGRGPIAPSRTLCVAVDAGRGQVYIEYLDAGGRTLEGPVLVSVGSAAERAKAIPALVVGSGARLLAEADAIEALTGAVEPRAADFALAAFGLEPAIGPVRPLYFRPADAVMQTAPAGLRA